ncbi:cytotoxic translational repressor of toxin-antitoxin stability system [Leptothermofonsia sp. ETS-13]|uniref:cytotoxic translational repressor of toxin-antitoxin stability system n=1 Tax=Leptothermofonsia sp. ETS-13 TaxID=3035696 RepID=UPI003BA0EA68
MQVTRQSSTQKTRAAFRYEVRYKRSFLLDVKRLEPAARKQIQQFVFEDFYQTTQLQELPEFRQLGSSKIYYRFTLDRYLVSLEVTGQIVKFLRVIRKPDL